jgi:2-keto-4-pentenoate hydratase/2-oxohepta-3-ene-1,7-dioic acid hydratase in catechol pathway
MQLATARLDARTTAVGVDPDGGVVIEDGDVAECWIPGIGTLANPVRRA